ncbi:MAG TPA: ATP synthase F1 subunit gamma [Bacteroidales bacterium]|jgi:F-type H+-transporting ATPase subunit gamma|nr:ATP synthase F1 subunit gamma [Bacteroidales bacterium]
MANLKEIRIRLNSVKSTRQITSAMKMVSAAKLRKAQDAIFQLRPFYYKLHEILKKVSSGMDEKHESVFTRSTDAGKILLVVITSNRGLCGAFNSNIVKRTIQVINEQYPEAWRNGKVDLIAIGKKGADQLKTRNYKVTATYHQLFDKLTFDKSTDVANQLINDFVQQKYGIIKIIYNQFKNAAVQDVTEEFLLPLLPDPESEDKFESPTEYILEPSNTEIINEMIPYTLRVQFFRSLLESNAAEHGARMTAMHKATDNATELIRELELNYNKARQASITREILEIVGGAEAQKE